jgi:hypothetical protein
MITAVVPKGLELFYRLYDLHGSGRHDEGSSKADKRCTCDFEGAE